MREMQRRPIAAEQISGAASGWRVGDGYRDRGSSNRRAAMVPRLSVEDVRL